MIKDWLLGLRKKDFLNVIVEQRLVAPVVVII
jgi:hypothetical protein